MAEDGSGETTGAIATGAVLPPVERFAVGNVTATYRGAIQLEGRTVIGIIKDLPAKELANELLGAALARAAGLPIPLPILAIAAPDTTIGMACPLPDGTGGLVFASTLVDGSSVRQLYLAAPGEDMAAQLVERLAGWTDAGRLYGFDTWIANVDRNPGNLMLSGTDDVWLIDHGQGFTGPTWAAANFDPAAAYPNRLREWLTPYLTDEQREQLSKTIGGASDEFDRAALAAAATEAHLASLLDAGDQEAVLSFLADRIAHVPRLASGALGFLA